jgi:hypothetical protein
MFVRVKRSVRDGYSYEYLQIVESRRRGSAVRQHVIATLGRKDEIIADGTLDNLLGSLASFSQRLKVVERVRSEGVAARASRAWGPSLVFGRLWQQQGLPEILARLAAERRFEFDLERTAFALALQRLCEAGSDLAGSQWLSTVEAPGFEAIQLQHLYRTVGFLAEVREELERELFFRDRDLFNQELDLVFIDTTSTFFWRDEESVLVRRGHSRDRRPDQPQVVLCVAVDRTGFPVAWDILPGNTADANAFAAMITRLRTRLKVRRVIVVADRGMISAKSIRLLTDSAKAPFDFILGTRMRRQKEVSETVLARAGRYQTVGDNLEVKEVSVGEKRYIVCRNPVEQVKDAAAREAILTKLEATLKQHGPKSVIGNKGFARFVKVAKGSVTIDPKAIEADARLDGKFVLVTNTDLPADVVALAYKSLWRVERAFRETKSTLEVRPIYHHSDEAIVGHIVACFLALRLEVDLQKRLDERGSQVSWPDLMRDLRQLSAVDLTLDGQRYRLRTELQGQAHHAFAAAGVRQPATVTHLGEGDPPPLTRPRRKQQRVVPKSKPRLVTNAT